MEEHQFNVNVPLIQIDDLISKSPALQLSCKRRKTNEGFKLVYDFTKSLNQFKMTESIVLEYFGLEWYELDRKHLCPRVPNRLEYLRLVETRLMESVEVYYKYVEDAKMPIENRWIIDIGTGSSMIYPILGQHMNLKNRYICTEIDAESISHATEILSKNPSLSKRIQFTTPETGMIPSSRFPVMYTVCNPPFYKSLDHMLQLKKKGKLDELTITLSELYCEGGEYSFIREIIDSSVSLKEHANYKNTWFTTQVGIQLNLALVEKYLESVGVVNIWKECIRFGTSRWIIGWCWNVDLRMKSPTNRARSIDHSRLVEKLEKLNHPYKLVKSSSGYYLLISAPMWLRRVRRKAKEYSSEYKLILEIGQDVHLLYNAIGIADEDVLKSWNMYVDRD